MDHENKILKLLETIVADGVDLKKGQSKLEKHMDKLELRMENVEDNIDKLGTHMENNISIRELRIENEVIDKVRALFDVREVQNDVNERIINALNRIEAKVDVLQMETASIRRVK